jgi:hypothetical protein
VVPAGLFVAMPVPAVDPVPVVVPVPLNELFGEPVPTPPATDPHGLPLLAPVRLLFIDGLFMPVPGLIGAVGVADGFDDVVPLDPAAPAAPPLPAPPALPPPAPPPPDCADAMPALAAISAAVRTASVVRFMAIGCSLGFCPLVGNVTARALFLAKHQFAAPISIRRDALAIAR